MDQTIWSGLFYGLQKRLRSGTGLDRGQSRYQPHTMDDAIDALAAGDSSGEENDLDEYEYWRKYEPR